MEPLVSIITINRNDLEGLRRTHRSIAGQECRDFEWIVIDGASTDGSAEYIADNAADCAYSVSEPDTGIYNAMNKGVERARGRYLLFLNSGDCLADSRVMADFAALDTEADVVYGRAQIVDSAGREMWQWPLPPMPLRLSYFWDHALKHQATFFAARCFEKFRYNEKHRINSDTELMMTLLYNNYVFEAYDRVVSRFNGEGLSSKPEARPMMDREFADTLERLMPEGMRRDYEDVIMVRDVPLAQMAATIVRSRRWLRLAARVVLYPIYAIARRQRRD